MTIFAQLVLKATSAGFKAGAPSGHLPTVPNSMSVYDISPTILSNTKIALLSIRGVSVRPFCQEKNLEAFSPFSENCFHVSTAKCPGVPVRPGRVGREQLRKNRLFSCGLASVVEDRANSIPD
jgi:hypothetical protein